MKKKVKKKWEWGDKAKVARLAKIPPSNLDAIITRKRQPRDPLIFKLKDAADKILGTDAITLKDLLQVKSTKNKFFK